VPFKASKTPTTSRYIKIQKMTPVKAIPAIVTTKTSPVIYLTLHAMAEFHCR